MADDLREDRKVASERGDDVGPLAGQLAAFASELEFDSIPHVTIEHAKQSILDTLGCALFGASLPWIEKLRAVVLHEQGRHEATLWGSEHRVTGVQAALVNATAAHAFELDDVHMGGMIHPGALALGAALAVGEERDLSGTELLTSFVVGCEVGARVGESVGIQHFRAGHHPQGTVGVFVAAAAAARALCLDQAQVQDALGLAGSQSAGLMAAQEGSMAKRLHSGLACQGGVRSAQLAAVGFTGIADVFEAKFGGFWSTLGGGDVRPEALTVGLGSTWETDGIGFKRFASCSAAQSSIEAARLLRDELGAAHATAASVLVRCSTHTKLHCGWRYEPTGVTAAQMSIPYGVASMLLHGDVSVARFTDDAITDLDTVRLAQAVEVESDDELDELGPDKRYVVRMSVTSSDGRRFEREVLDRPGGPTQPLSDDELRGKFKGLAGPVLGVERADELLDLVASLESMQGVGELVRLIKPARVS